jgi:hypothetical protein
MYAFSPSLYLLPQSILLFLQSLIKVQTLFLFFCRISRSFQHICPSSRFTTPATWWTYGRAPGSKRSARAQTTWTLRVSPGDSRLAWLCSRLPKACDRRSSHGWGDAGWTTTSSWYGLSGQAVASWAPSLGVIYEITFPAGSRSFLFWVGWACNTHFSLWCWWCSWHGR